MSELVSPGVTANSGIATTTGLAPSTDETVSSEKKETSLAGKPTNNSASPQPNVEGSDAPVTSESQEIDLSKLPETPEELAKRDEILRQKILEEFKQQQQQEQQQQQAVLQQQQTRLSHDQYVQKAITENTNLMALRAIVDVLQKQVKNGYPLSKELSGIVSQEFIKEIEDAMALKASVQFFQNEARRDLVTKSAEILGVVAREMNLDPKLWFDPKSHLSIGLKIAYERGDGIVDNVELDGVNYYVITNPEGFKQFMSTYIKPITNISNVSIAGNPSAKATPTSSTAGTPIVDSNIIFNSLRDEGYFNSLTDEQKAVVVETIAREKMQADKEGKPYFEIRSPKLYRLVNEKLKILK